MRAAATFGEARFSQSNGSLMRCSPIGIYAHKLTDDEIALIGNQDSGLSHPSETICTAVGCYSIAIAELISHPTSTGRDAFNRVKKWAEMHATKDVINWLHDAEEGKPVEFYPAAGHAKVAFTLAFYHLIRETQFNIALEQVLIGGGDTDTNACIVGGLLGALYGSENLPQKSKNTVLNCDTTKFKSRPSYLSTHQLPHLASTLLKVAPTALITTKLNT